MITRQEPNVSTLVRKKTIFLLEDEDEDLQHLNDILGNDFKITYRKSNVLAKAYLSDSQKAKPDLICINVDTFKEDRMDMFQWIGGQPQLKGIPVFLLSQEILENCNSIKKPYTANISAKLQNAAKK